MLLPPAGSEGPGTRSTVKPGTLLSGVPEDESTWCCGDDAGSDWVASHVCLSVCLSKNTCETGVGLPSGVFEEHEGEEEGELALGCLQNLLMGDTGCVEVFVRCGGPEQVQERQASECPHQLQSSMATILKTVELVNSGQQPL